MMGQDFTGFVGVTSLLKKSSHIFFVIGSMIRIVYVSMNLPYYKFVNYIFNLHVLHVNLGVINFLSDFIWFNFSFMMNNSLLVRHSLS